MKKALILFISLFIVFSTVYADEEVSCSSEQEFSEFSCSTCYSGGELSEGDILGNLSNVWSNNSIEQKKEVLTPLVQTSPFMYRLGSIDDVSWREMTTGPNFWVHTQEVIALNDSEYDGYVLNPRESVTWIKLASGATYNLKKNNMNKGENIGLLVYPIKVQSVLDNNNLSEFYENNDCVLYKSSGVTGKKSYSLMQLNAANYLADEYIIVPHYDNPDNYSLSDYINKRDLAFILRGIYNIPQKSICENIFEDVKVTGEYDKECYTIEALVEYGIIPIEENFYPYNNITRIDLLKIVLEATFGEEFNEETNQDIVKFAVKKGIIGDFIDYDSYATKGFAYEVIVSSVMILTSQEIRNDDISKIIDDVLIDKEEINNPEASEIMCNIFNIGCETSGIDGLYLAAPSGQNNDWAKPILIDEKDYSLNIGTKHEAIKTMNITKYDLKKSKKGDTYIVAIDTLVVNFNDEKLLEIYDKITKIDLTDKSLVKYKTFLEYLISRMRYELHNRVVINS